MKTFYKIALGTAILTALIIVISSPKEDNECRLAKVADEGYETADDILFPSTKRTVDKRLHYGPVLPAL